MIDGSTPDLRALCRNARQVPVILDRGSPVPLYYQLYEQLNAAIETGLLLPGDPLESEVAIAERVELSRPTVRRAIAELTSKGLVVRRRGVGTVIARSAVRSGNEFRSLFDDLSETGARPTTSLLEYSTGRTDRRAAEVLGLPRGARMLYIERVRWNDGSPIAVLRNWLPPVLATLSASDLVADGLYTLLRAHDVQPAVAHQSIGSRAATPHEKALLRLGRTDPVLTVERKTFDAGGQAIEYGEQSYRFDAYRYDVTVHAS